MSFLHIHLVWICHSSTCICSGYVIPPHTSGLDMSFLHIHTSGPDVSFLHIQKGVLGSFVVKKKSFFFCFGSLSTTSEIHQDSAFFPSL
jgi:hypothetical protein